MHQEAHMHEDGSYHRFAAHFLTLCTNFGEIAYVDQPSQVPGKKPRKVASKIDIELIT